MPRQTDSGSRPWPGWMTVPLRPLSTASPGRTVLKKAWLPRFSPDGRFTTVVQQDGEWTLAVDDGQGESSFDYLWDAVFVDGSVIAACMQSGGEYGMCVDGTAWETLENMNQTVLFLDGSSSAGVVQLESLKPADLDAFQAGVFGVAVDGQAWDSKFLNAWTPIVRRHRKTCGGAGADQPLRVFHRRGRAALGRTVRVRVGAPL